MSGILVTTGAAAGFAALALATFAVGGLRARLLPHKVAFVAFVVAAVAGLYAVVASVVGLIRTPPPLAPADFGLGAVGLVFGLAVAAPVARFAYALLSSPWINDISTDTDDPPRLEVAATRRPAGSRSVEYGGEESAALQHHAYPNVAPGRLAAPPAEAYARALALARERRWGIVAERPDEGIFEAEDATSFLNFVDDVVVRVRPDGDGARVDVRSASRVGDTDTGVNARRIESYLADLTGVTARAGRP